MGAGDRVGERTAGGGGDGGDGGDGEGGDGGGGEGGAVTSVVRPVGHWTPCMDWNVCARL